WSAILSSGEANWLQDNGKVMAAGEKLHGKGVFRVCEIEFDNKMSNPVAKNFFHQLLASTEEQVSLYKTEK
ncbi:MAG: hypothetical protein ABJG41_18450, partial [Cyclobacteriaceae bacterium]